MDIYILDPQFRRETVIDQYESLIWTERFTEMGDFELSVLSNYENRSLLHADVKLAIDPSRRVMEIDEVEDTVDEEGRKILRITGKSIEKILEDRGAYTRIGLPGVPEWEWVGTPGGTMRELFDATCRDTFGYFAADVIPLLQPGSIFPADTIPEPEEQYTFRAKRGSLYSALKTLAEAYDLGFRLVRNYDRSELYFDVYSGINRTATQNTHTPIVFSPELDTVQNTRQLTSKSTYKNVAYVFSKHPQLYHAVYAADADANTRGFDRRVLYVDGTDIDLEPGAALDVALRQRGEAELAMHRKFFALDGEVTINSPFTYGVDYNLGDVVEMRIEDGTTTQMRVTEYIFASDSEGDRSYPTLVSRSTVAPDTWFSWEWNIFWDDAVGTWAEV